MDPTENPNENPEFLPQREKLILETAEKIIEENLEAFLELAK